MSAAMATPRETVRKAFYEVLNNSLGADIPVLDSVPFEGAPPKSVVIGMVSGVETNYLGSRVGADKSGSTEQYRVQISVHSNISQDDASAIADQVEEVLTGATAALRSGYGVFHVHKVGDVDRAPTEALERLAHSIVDYSACIVREKADPT
jgi:hypothetical protein